MSYDVFNALMGAMKDRDEDEVGLYLGCLNITTANLADEITGTTLLMQSCELGLWVKQILDSGAKETINARNIEGNTALSIAVCACDAQIIETLLSCGADASLFDLFGWNVLHKSALNRNKEITELLILHGADVNIATDLGITPLMCAVKNQNKADGAEIISLLLSNGADITQKNIDGATALDIAVKEGNFKAAEMLAPKRPKKHMMLIYIQKAASVLLLLCAGGLGGWFLKSSYMNPAENPGIVKSSDIAKENLDENFAVDMSINDINVRTIEISPHTMTQKRVAQGFRRGRMHGYIFLKSESSEYRDNIESYIKKLDDRINMIREVSGRDINTIMQNGFNPLDLTNENAQIYALFLKDKKDKEIKDNSKWIALNANRYFSLAAVLPSDVWRQYEPTDSSFNTLEFIAALRIELRDKSTQITDYTVEKNKPGKHELNPIEKIF